MEVLIIGMEMPKERESFTVTIKYNGLVFDTETGIQVAEAQEVPPHGDLIERDALREEVKKHATPSDAWVFSLIRTAPTIIPASEELK